MTETLPMTAPPRLADFTWPITGINPSDYPLRRNLPPAKDDNMIDLDTQFKKVIEDTGKPYIKNYVYEINRRLKSSGNSDMSMAFAVLSGYSGARVSSD